MLKKQDWNPFSLEPVEFAELNFDFHPRAIKRYLSENQFAIEKQLSVSFFRVGFLRSIFLLACWQDWIPCFSGPAELPSTARAFLQWHGQLAVDKRFPRQRVCLDA